MQHRYQIKGRCHWVLTNIQSLARQPIIDLRIIFVTHWRRNLSQFVLRIVKIFTLLLYSILHRQ